MAAYSSHIRKQQNKHQLQRLKSANISKGIWMDGDMWINLFDRQMSNFVHVHVHLHIWTYTCTCPYMDIYIHVCHVIFFKRSWTS